MSGRLTLQATALTVTIRLTRPGNRFDENLAAMIERAGRYFGRDSDGLVRKFEGTVELSETQVIGVEETSPAPATSDEESRPSPSP